MANSEFFPAKGSSAFAIVVCSILMNTDEITVGEDFNRGFFRYSF